MAAVGVGSRGRCNAVRSGRAKLYTFEFLHTEADSRNYVMVLFISWLEMVENGRFAGIV